MPNRDVLTIHYCFLSYDYTRKEQLEKAEATVTLISTLLGRDGPSASAAILQHVNGLLSSVVTSLSTVGHQQQQPPSAFTAKEHFTLGQKNPLQVKGFYAIKKPTTSKKPNCLQ